MAETGLILDDLRVALPDHQILHLSAHVQPGQVVSVMGPSGSGKSTLLGAIMGTLAAPFAVSGRVVLNGRDVTTLPTQSRGIGILFQDPLLFAHLSVGANLAFGLPRRIRGADRRTAVDAALDQVGLSGFAPRDPATLSGGQKVRVALMRTLLAAPDALLLDEPFASLDADRRAQMRALVFGRARAAGLPVLMVTHDAQDAHAAGGPVLRLG